MRYIRPTKTLFLLAISVLGWVPAVGYGISNQTYRSTQSLYILGEVGSAVVPVVTKGFVAGAHLLPNTAVEFSYAGGMRDVEYAKLYAKMYTMRLKTFWSDSFYSNLGLGYRVVGDETTTKASEVIFVERKGRSTGLDMSIGNRWSFGGLTVGCDWIGFFHPFDYVRSETFGFRGQPQGQGRPSGSQGQGQGQQHAGPNSGGGSGSGQQSGGGSSHGGKDFDRHQTDWDRLSKYGTLEVLRLQVGYAF